LRKPLRPTAVDAPLVFECPLPSSHFYCRDDKKGIQKQK